jgi:FkbM family methyltransferase
MNLDCVLEPTTVKLVNAFRLIKKVGITTFAGTIYYRLSVKLKILSHGRSRIVSIDGCQFGLHALPDTEMKLELLAGDYEGPERRAACRFIDPAWPVVELGACIGVVACVTNKLLANPKAHVVLEASPNAIPHLQANRDANCCSFRIVNKALAYGVTTVTFVPQDDYWRNHMDHDGGHPPVTVMATQLRQLLAEEQFEKFALICDIEGREYELVMQESDALTKAELIVMEVHPYMIGEEKIQTLLARLHDLGFKMIEKSKLVVVMSRSEFPVMGLPTEAN